MNQTLKIICCLAVVFPVTSFAGKVPKDKEELAKWIVGTEWKATEQRKGKWIQLVRRFHPNGVMKNQQGVSKWTAGHPIQTYDYKVLSENSMQFGTLKWAIVFDEDFTKYKAKSSKIKHAGRGKLLGRFK